MPKLYPAFQGVNYVSGDAADGSRGGGTVVYISGGKAPYSCSVAKSAQPAGMRLTEAVPPIYPAGICKITGRPTTSGDYPLTLKVADAGGNTATANLTFVVLASRRPQITARPVAAAASPTSETITWTTDVPASSKVCYSIGYAVSACTPESDLTGVTSHAVTVTGLLPSNGYQYFVESRGVASGAPQDYLATSGSQLTFSTEAPGSGLSTLIMAYGIGPHNVVQGNPLYVGIHYGPIQGAASLPGTVFTVTGLPPFAQVHWPDQQDNNLHQGSVSTTHTTNDTLTMYGLGANSVTQFEILTNQGGTTPVGNYTLAVSYSVISGGLAAPGGSFTWTLGVEPAVTFTATPPAAYPPIPDLALWQAQMVGTGVSNESYWYNGQQRGGACEWDSDDQGIAYYDGAWVYDQIGIYTGKLAHWLRGNSTSPCPSSTHGHGPQGAAAAAALYHQYLIATNYNVPGYWVFPHGLYYACVTGGSAQACRDLHGLARGTNGSLLADNTVYFDAVEVRETSYALGLKRLDYDTGTGDTTLAQVRQLVNYDLAHLDNIVHGTTGYEQPFMDGLAAQALIEYYMDPKTGNQSDSRIPVAIQALADHLWATEWVPRAGNNGMFIYNLLTDQNGGENDGQGSDYRNLNLLIAPMYAWLYRETGAMIYQQEGDVIWDSGVTDPAGNGIGWSGKNFSQQYRWSFEYVKWRSGRSGGPV
ncbi:MAG: hypothetical protein ACRD1C_13965 [Terriglobales bacterium]